MKKKYLHFRYGLIIFMSILIICCLVYLFNKIPPDFSNSIFVITKNETNGTTNYYEINDHGMYRNVDKFENDKMETYIVENSYESYIRRNKVLNRLTLDTAVLKDNEGNSLKITEDFRNIITEVAQLEHDIMHNKILKLDNKYYVVVMLNVNLWTPYSLYYYDTDNQELKHLYTFNGEDIIGLKLK